MKSWPYLLYTYVYIQYQIIFQTKIEVFTYCLVNGIYHYPILRKFNNDLNKDLNKIANYLL